MVQTVRSGTVLLAGAVVLSCVLALVCVQQLATEGDGVVELKSVAQQKDATASNKAIQTILKRMEKKKVKSHPKSQTRSIKDDILADKSKLVKLKFSDSQTFAKWEKENEISESAKTKALSLHEILQEDKSEEDIYSKKISDLKKKLSKHLTAQSARSELNEYYASLDKAAKKTIPKAIKKADKESKVKAVQYKKAMEAKKALVAKKIASLKPAHGKKTVALKEISPVNVWDTAPGMNEDRVAIAQKHLKKAMLDADKQIINAEAHKKR